MDLLLIFNIVFLLGSTLVFSISFAILGLIFRFDRPTTADVSLLLTCNTYLSMIVMSATLFDFCGHNLYGYIHPTVSFAGQWCEIRAYVLHGSFCAFYYSFVLQAIFRLFRVLFYRKKVLHSFGLFLIATIFKWMLSFVLVLFTSLSGDFVYHPFDYSCWVSFRNVRGVLIGTAYIYATPLSIIFTSYVLILRHVRRVNSQQTQCRQQRANKRDMVVVKRLILLLLFLILIALPGQLVFVVYLVTGYLTPWVNHIQMTSLPLGVAMTAINLALVTPRVRNTFKRQRQVQPMGMSQTNAPMTMTILRMKERERV